MAQAIHLARLVLGVIFLVFGLNGFVTVIPVPEFHPCMTLLVASGYLSIVKSIEIVGGALFLANRYVPLALTLLGPVVVNILLYHLFLDPRNWQIAPILAGLFGLLLWAYRRYFASLVVPRATTTFESKIDSV